VRSCHSTAEEACKRTPYTEASMAQHTTHVQVDLPGDWGLSKCFGRRDYSVVMTACSSSQ
jgi:hypothetical protein